MTIEFLWRISLQVDEENLKKASPCICCFSSSTQHDQSAKAAFPGAAHPDLLPSHFGVPSPATL